MNLAAEIAAARPEARILVCVADVRSGLQNQLPGTATGEHSRAALLSCALFRDAASAVIMGGRCTLALAHACTHDHMHASLTRMLLRQGM